MSTSTLPPRTAAACALKTMGADRILTTHVGSLIRPAELLEAMPPFLGGGEMIRDVRLDGFTCNDLPWKFEAGTSPITEAALASPEGWLMTPRRTGTDGFFVSVLKRQAA